MSRYNDPNRPLLDRVLQKRKPGIKCGGCACVTIVLLTLAIIALTLVSALALNNAANHNTAKVYSASGELQPNPFGQLLSGGGSPLAMTLPDDVADFLHKTYSMTSIDNQTHVLTLPTGVTFDGGLTVATFDGQIGSSITYRPVLASKIHVVSVFGVTLS